MAAPIETAVDGHVGLLRLDSPATRNALGTEMKAALLAAVQSWDADPEVRCVVIAGSERVFAAGADIRAMAELGIDTPPDPEATAFWAGLAAVETPLVAAVSGYALGGGCELAMACDMIVADATARFGQPEVTLGIIPGGGGTQRLTRAIGKARAMEYVLTGRLFEADQAAEWGLVNAVAKQGRYLEEALALAQTIAARPPLATRLAKRAVLEAEEHGLATGIEAERRLFDEAMATEDRIEGMNAFLEKREPRFKGR
ncbi:MAG: enoyl-CoA hydratase-related protein [Solirubrobacterales bacterium]